ncbi:hypothetical protein BDW62DRAFT_192287 [Aspergillus aurantiobrunneus]
MDAAFAKLKSLSIDWSFRVPTEKAGFDLNRFMEKYFLRLGAPDPAKTKELLEITCRPEFEDCLLVAVKTVLGLHHRHGTPYASDKVMFIGWDPEKVNKKVRTIEEERARKIAQIAAEEQTEEEEQRVAIFKPHTDFMRNFTTTPGTLTLNDLKGSFLAHSLEIEDYTDNYDGLNLYIQLPSSPQSHGVVAEFHFGVVKGTTILLSLPEDSLHTFAEEMALIDSDSNEDDSDSNNFYSQASNVI